MEGAFSQPNSGVSAQMLAWAQDVTRGSGGHDLLELYCGNGNFTVALAGCFRQVGPRLAAWPAFVGHPASFPFFWWMGLLRVPVRAHACAVATGRKARPATSAHPSARAPRPPCPLP